ncbi:NAD(P)H-hydrate dehydratase [Oceanibium sediminis]|uniref:NAD(P)H-hydrate dehydratase n=1 Tax=Oceanibium sediminis TaxID=2026339 RepID=UPI000DD3CE35|nr:NAD(P)H-hydrate dehydratase [Oceanibium sediminis]
MTELLTAARMRAIEQAAIDSGAVTGLELMERAGQGVVDAMLEWRPALAITAHRAVVLCGPGNNGGDGFVIARLLKQRGWVVEVFLYGDESHLPPDAATNCRRWQQAGTIAALSVEALLQSDANRRGEEFCVIDAMFGTGLTRPLGSDLCDILSCAVATDSFARAPMICVDLPSGLCADSGRGLWARQPPLPCDALTVTFHAPKLGHFLAEGPNRCRHLTCKDIGLTPGPQSAATLLTGGPFIASALTKHRGPDAHKYAHGHALVMSGPPGKGGAARLAARGALRIGAGLVTVSPPPEGLAEHAAQLTAIMLEPVADADTLEGVLQDTRLNALCLGPGLGRGERTRALVRSALGAKRATVLDADALTSFSGNPPALFERLHENCVLTPHGGEFARLFPDIAKKLSASATSGPAFSKADATRDAAKRAGCTILFKGPDTVIADQAGQAAINAAHYERAAPWLATAGSGDVLAGFITGLLARGIAPRAAAETAAWLHVEAARHFGPGLIAEDLPEQLPAVLRALKT